MIINLLNLNRDINQHMYNMKWNVILESKAIKERNIIFAI